MPKFYKAPPSSDTPIFREVAFRDLPAYKNDHPNKILNNLLASCHSFSEMPGARDVGTKILPLKASDWQRTCKVIISHLQKKGKINREFFEKLFTPFEVTNKKGIKIGLFTGYYEAELEASYTRHGAYRYPIYKRPKNLKTTSKRKYKRYLTRAEINSGKLENKNLELLWGNDLLDIFILQIQGSGKVKLDNGKTVRIGYHGDNGYKYRSIASKMIRDGLIRAEQASWEGIRSWLERNPTRINKILNYNRRYIFFRISENQNSVLGAQGTPLIGGRSMATDLRYIPLGSLLWVDIENIAKKHPRKIRRFMMAQDTGAAIKGVVRGDFYWGHGKEALYYAGRMKNKGSYYILIPKIAARKIKAQSAHVK